MYSILVGAMYLQLADEVTYDTRCGVVPVLECRSSNLRPSKVRRRGAEAQSADTS